VFSLIILYVASLGIYTFENEAQPEVFGSIFDSLWWSIVTLTTVGYGDSFPITLGGKIFTFLIVIIGLGIISVPTGLFASALSKTIKEK
jgi:voltage-gated potassium channel